MKLDFLKRVVIMMSTVLLSVGCENMLRDELDGLRSEIDELRALIDKANSNIEALQTIVYALESNDYVTDVTPILENGVEVGYTIRFSKSGSVSIYNGKNGVDGKPGQDGAAGKDGYTPAISVKKDTDGVWYWTIDGEWLLDDNGNRIPTTGKDGAPGQDGKPGEDGKDGISPKLKIQDGSWYISYDNGFTWEFLAPARGDKGDVGETGPAGPIGPQGPAGSDGDTLISEIDITDDYVVITLANGQIIKLPTWNVRDEISDIMSMIQSITYVPEYYDGAAYVDRSGKDVEMNFKVSPSSVVSSLEKVWESSLSVKSITTRFTKSTTSMRDVSIKSAEFGSSLGIISLCLDCSDLDESFYVYGTSASVALFISDGKNNVSSDFIPLKLHSLFYDAIDLSEVETSDSYVVSSPGVYKFKAVKGNSLESVGVVYHVKVVWESFGTSTSPFVGDLINYISYEDGYIAFQTPDDFKEGIALIAAEDIDGTVLWTWNIWFTDQPQEHIYNNSSIEDLENEDWE